MNFLGKSKADWKNIRDEQLLEQYRIHGDQAAFAELFCRYTSLVYGLCKKYLEDADDAKDAVMQIFSKLSDQLTSEKPEQFKPWLYTVSKNFCLMQLRKQKNFAFDAEKHAGFMEYSDNGHLEEEELLRLRLEEVQNSLPEAQKICVQLFYIEEKSYREISEITGYTMNEIKSYIQNGRRNLKVRLEKGGYP